MTLVLPDKKDWGPKFWYVMKTAAIGIGEHPDDELQRHATVFYESLANMLPCPECRSHYSQLLQMYPVAEHVSSSKALHDWVEFIQYQVKEMIKSKRGLGRAIETSAQPTVRVIEQPVIRRNMSSAERLALAKKNYKRPCCC